MVLSQKIRKIDQICYEVIQNSQKLISTIDNLCKNSVNKLINLRRRYQDTMLRGELKELETEANVKTEEKKKNNSSPHSDPES